MEEKRGSYGEELNLFQVKIIGLHRFYFLILNLSFFSRLFRFLTFDSTFPT